MTSVTKRDIDYIESNLGASIKCEKLAGIINGKLSKYCIIVSCDSGQLISIVDVAFIGSGAKDVHPWIR